MTKGRYYIGIVSTASAILLTLTLLLATLFCLILWDVTSSVEIGDRAMGQGFEWLYTIVLFVFTWASLAGLLWNARSVLPARAGMAALLVWLVSAGTVAVCFSVLNPRVRWPIVMPAGLILLVAVYILVLSLPATRSFAASPSVGLGVLAGILFLTVPIWSAVYYYKIVEPNRQAAAYQAEMADPVKKAERREKALAKVQAMTADQPVEQWASLLEPENGVRAEAIEALRKVDRRQEDVEQLARHNSTFLGAVPELDLKLTPLLCSAIQDFIWNRAFVRQLQGERGQRFRADESDDAIASTIGWFQSRGCDCGPSLDKYAEDIRRSFKDSPERQAFLEVLAKLKQAH
jgi:hypothetical protein